MRLPGCGAGLVLALFTGVLLGADLASAHSGPPFPIVSSRTAGPYTISVWTDPDSSDDGSAAGSFWVTLNPSSGAPLPVETRVNVSINPLDRPGVPITVRAEPIDNDIARRFARLVMDHEGRFHVVVTIEGPLGPATVDADVDATYDLRPPAGMIVVYLIPFVGIGFLWVKLLLKRRRSERGATSRPSI